MSMLLCDRRSLSDGIIIVFSKSVAHQSHGCALAAVCKGINDASNKWLEVG